MMFKKISILVGIFYSCACFSGELVKNAKILQVASNGSNTANFAIQVEGGVGVCAGTPNAWIYFSENKAPSLASYNQSFSLAMLALTSDKYVRIHNYTGDSCTGADFIAVLK